MTFDDASPGGPIKSQPGGAHLSINFLLPRGGRPSDGPFDFHRHWR
jgi:hypothetical protein